MPSEPPRPTSEPAGSDVLIAIDHVTFGYDASRNILSDVSLAFRRSKVTSILGGSGCGKTTLLRLIGGVHAVNKGAVRFDGEVVNTRDRDQLFRLRRRLGMLFQFGALFTDLTVFENVAFPLREQTDFNETMIRDIVLMKLNAVGLRGAAQLRIAEVSGGMARRIALARAIVLDPEVIMHLRRARPHLDGRGGEPDPHAQRRDRSHVARGVARRTRVHGDQRPRHPPRRAGSGGGAGHARRIDELHRPRGAPVRPR